MSAITGAATRLLLLAFLALGAAACSVPASPPNAASLEGEVVVFAASSLTDAFKEIGPLFEHAHPGTRVTFSFGASSQLRTQLEQGARADIFASADAPQMDLARQAGVLATDDLEQVLARNRLTLIVPRQNPRGIASLHDLAADGVKLLAAQPSVPIGQYTATLLDRASADPAYGPDFRVRVERNVVSREENVRQVVAKVQLGEADAGIVYTSDVTPAVRGSIQQIPLPDALNILAAYPIAATARGSNPDAARAFLRFVRSHDARDILARWGFLPVAD